LPRKYIQEEGVAVVADLEVIAGVTFADLEVTIVDMGITEEVALAFQLVSGIAAITDVTVIHTDIADIMVVRIGVDADTAPMIHGILPIRPRVLSPFAMEAILGRFQAMNLEKFHSLAPVCLP